MIKICFVCLGNICRSPMAEYIMKDKIDRLGLSDKVFITSRGTSYEESGNDIYPPAKRELDKHNIGYDLHRATRLEKEDYDNKRAEVLKGRQFSELGDQTPTFCDKTLEEVIPFNYLNEEGIKALREVLWLLNGVLPKMEYCPGLVSVASFLLLFLSKEETYELLRNIVEADLNPGDLSNIRWHFRYTLNDNIRLYLSIANLIAL